MNIVTRIYPLKCDYRYKALKISPAVLRIVIEGIYFSTMIILSKETDNTSGGWVREFVTKMHTMGSYVTAASSLNDVSLPFHNVWLQG